MSGLQLLRCLVPRFRPNVAQFSSQAPAGSSDAPYSSNDVVAPRIRNRNPMNLERMRIGRKPRGFSLEVQNREYWNKLSLEISNNHTTAVVTHWTGRPVAKASTREWPIRKFLFNLTDGAAVAAVGQIISQRCLETGISEVYLEVDKEDLEKEKMKKFISVIEESGLCLKEPSVYEPENVHCDTSHHLQPKAVQPWTVLEE